MVEDRRNYLYKCYARFLEKYRPRRFVFENVVGLLSAKDGDGRGYFDAMRGLFHRIGYETGYSTLWGKGLRGAAKPETGGVGSDGARAPVSLIPSPNDGPLT